MNTIAKMGHNRSPGTPFDTVSEKITDLYAALSYNPATGEFRWLRDMGARAKAGHSAGAAWSNSKGSRYLILTVKKRRYAAHRVAHLFMTGRWPSGQIDHLDGNGLNNKWCNLRECSQSQNQGNARKRRDNSSGYKGVSFHSATGKFCARIQHDGERVHLGLFETAQEAHAEYCKAADDRFGSFARVA